MAEINKWEELFNSSIKNLQAVWNELSKDLSTEYEDAIKKNRELTAENSWLKEMIDKHQMDINDGERKYLELQRKYDILQEEVKILGNELEKADTKIQHFSKTNIGGSEMLEIFDMFLMLMENVFNTGPHIRLLLMLHSDQEVFSLKELTDKSGYSPVDVKSAMKDLNIANVVEFDDELKEIRLIQRFF